MVPSECKDGGHRSDEIAEEDVETMVSEVGPAGWGDVNACEEGNYWEY